MLIPIIKDLLDSKIKSSNSNSPKTIDRPDARPSSERGYINPLSRIKQQLSRRK